MSSLDQLVRLDDYQQYLKYRKPPNSAFTQVPNKKNVWVPTEQGGFQQAVVVDESDDKVTVVQLVKDESVRSLCFLPWPSLDPLRPRVTLLVSAGAIPALRTHA